MATWEEQSSAYLASHQLGSPLTYEQWLSNYAKTNVGVHKHPIKIRYTYPPPGAGSGPSVPAGFDQAALYMNFMQNAARLNGVWSSALPLLTTTRASVAQMDSAAGFWGQFANDAPRWSDKGLLIEEARTNSMRSNTATGAVVGTPGTLPTTGYTLTGMGTLASQVVSIGNEKGIDYFDLRIFGTSSTGGISLRLEAATTIAALTAQTWAMSSFLSLVGGSLANITFMALRMQEATAAGALVLNKDGPDFKASLSASLQRFSNAATLTGGGTVACIVPFISIILTTATAIDFTLRIGWPQLEQGGFPTSPIKTSGAAATRAADSINSTALVPTAPGTIWADFVAGTATPPAPGFAGIFGANDGTNNERVWLDHTTAPAVRGAMTDGGVTQVAITPAGTIVVGTPSKAAMAFAANDVAACRDGGTIVTDLVATLPTMTKFIFGREDEVGKSLCGYLRRCAYWPTRQADAVLQAITSP